MRSDSGGPSTYLKQSVNYQGGWIPISQISKCIIRFSARALTAGQLGAIFVTGDAWTFSDGLSESATTLPSFPSHFPLSVVYIASYDLGLKFSCM